MTICWTWFIADKQVDGKMTVFILLAYFLNIPDSVRFPWMISGSVCCMYPKAYCFSGCLLRIRKWILCYFIHIWFISYKNNSRSENRTKKNGPPNVFYYKSIDCVWKALNLRKQLMVIHTHSYLIIPVNIWSSRKKDYKKRGESITIIKKYYYT